MSSTPTSVNDTGKELVSERAGNSPVQGLALPFWSVLAQAEADSLATGADFQNKASCRSSAVQRLKPGEGKEASGRVHQWALKVYVQESHMGSI